MGTVSDRSENIRKLAQMIKDIRIAMLTTVEPDGRLRARPMAAQEVAFDGTLWFFTKVTAPKVDEIQHNQRVSISFAAPDQGRYVSITGTAELVRDADRLRALWSPTFRAWFPDGPEDPYLALLKVEVELAEYWDGRSGAVTRLAGLVLSLAAGHPVDLGDHGKLNLQPPSPPEQAAAPAA